MKSGVLQLNGLIFPSFNVSASGLISSLQTTEFLNFRFTSSSAITIEGLADGVDGKSVILQNTASSSMIIKDQTGTVNEQIITGLGTDYSLPIGTALHLIYDGISQKWRVANPIAIGSGSGTYTNPNPTPVTVGGIPAGSTFLTQTLQQMFDALLYPFQAPAFTSLTSSLFGTYEVGEALPTGLATVNYAISNFGSVSPSPSGIQATTLSGASFPVANPLALVASGSFQINVAAATTLSAPGTRTVSLSGTDINASTFSISRNIDWRFRVFYGNDPQSALLENDVEALSSNLLTNTSVRVYSFGAASLNYKWICYPTTMTTLTTFTDTGTNFAVPFEAPIVVSVTNPFGVTQNYNCHRSTNPLGGAMNIAAS